MAVFRKFKGLNIKYSQRDPKGTSLPWRSSHRPWQGFLGHGVGDFGHVVGRPGTATPSTGGLVGRRRGTSPTLGHVLKLTGWWHRAFAAFQLIEGL